MRKHLAPRAAGIIVAVAGGALAGCASTDTITQSRMATERAEAMVQVAAQPATPADVSPIKVKDGAYVSAFAARNERGEPLPGGWERRPFNLGRARLASFQEIANAITEVTTIPVAVTAINSGSVTNVSSRGPTPAAGGIAPNLAGPLPPGADPALAGALGALGGPGGGFSQQTIRAVEPPTGDLGISGRMQVRHEGSLPQFLDLVATNFNVAWEYKEGKIVFQRFITRTFEVPALPTVSKIGFQLRSGGKSDASTGGQGSSGGEGGAMQTASTEAAFDLWKDLDETIKLMMSREGGIAQVSSQKGTVTVIASPSAVRNVADYLKQLNQQLAKQVAINVKVYSVVLNDGDNYSSDINILLQDRFPGSTAVKSVIGISNGGAASGVVPNVVRDTVTGGIVQPPLAGLNVVQSGNNQGVGWAILGNGRYAGSNGIANLLSQKGDVSVVTSASATALNGQPVPIQVANTRGYVAQVSTTPALATGLGAAQPQTTIQQASVTTGFNLHLMPKIQRDNTIMLQYGLNVSELVGADNGFDTFTTGQQTVQLPNINQRNFIQQAILPNASTLVLAGFEQVRASSLKQGQVQPWLWPLGGSSNAQMRREIMVVAITPTIVDVSAPASGIPAAGVGVASAN